MQRAKRHERNARECQCERLELRRLLVHAVAVEVQERWQAVPFKLFDGFETSAYIALDAGRVWGPSDVNLVGHALAGAALGLRGRHKSLQFDAALGLPIHKPDGFVTSTVAPYISATYGF